MIFYNLDVIISVGYRVKSQQGTQFRIWATKRFKEYIVKGLTLNDERKRVPDYAGKISHQKALEKLGEEYEKIKLKQKELAREANLKEIEEDIKKLKK